MIQSENINELATALSKAQAEMQTAVKDKLNSFLKSKYADLGSVWDVARPVLSKHGMCIMQTTEVSPDMATILLVTTLAHTSGQWMKSYLPLKPKNYDSQGIGAAITYSRRYSLASIIGVVCDDDDDGETAIGRGKTKQEETPPQEPQKAVQRLNKEQIAHISSLLNQLDNESTDSFFKAIKKEYNAESIIEIPSEKFEKCCISLNNKIKYLNDQKANA